MTNAGLVLLKLQTLRDHLQRLEERQERTPADARERRDLEDATAMSLFVCVQEAIDIVSHIVSDEGWGIPDTYAAGFAIAAEHQLLDSGTAAVMGQMSALRNRIAHGYSSVDAQRIARELPVGIQALRKFSEQVARFTAAAGA